MNVAFQIALTLAAFDLLAVGYFAIFADPWDFPTWERFLVGFMVIAAVAVICLFIIGVWML